MVSGVAKQKYSCAYLDEVFIHFIEEISDWIKTSDNAIMNQEKPHIYYNVVVENMHWKESEEHNMPSKSS